MKPDTDYHALTESLDEWITTDLGQLVLDRERTYLQQIVRELFGYYLLEVSLFCDPVDFMQDSPIRNHILFGPCRHSGREHVFSLPEQLPVASDSVDVVVLPHTLDFTPEPHQVLREVERVLIPEGRVVICGFKPFSLWGMWKMLPVLNRRLPWKGNFIASARMEDWLSLLGFETDHVQLLMFRPPWKRMFIQNRMQAWERLGQRFWSRFAGIYILVAIKRESTLTPIRPRWQLRPRLHSTASEPVGFSFQHEEEKNER